MTTLELKINVADELIAQAGVASLKNYLEQAAENFQVDLLAQKIRPIVGDDEKIDTDFQQAKKQAWDEYKARYMPEHLQQVVQRREPNQ